MLCISVTLLDSSSHHRRPSFLEKSYLHGLSRARRSQSEIRAYKTRPNNATLRRSWSIRCLCINQRHALLKPTNVSHFSARNHHSTTRSWWVDTGSPPKPRGSSEHSEALRKPMRLLWTIVLPERRDMLHRREQPGPMWSWRCSCHNSSSSGQRR